MRFGNYKLGQTLKQRGPIITRRAVSDVSGDTVILKMLRKDAVNSERVAALRRENTLIREISSSRVVNAIELIWEDDCPALVLEDLDGDVLAEKLTDAALPMGDALRLALGASQALEAVQDAGIMHGILTLTTCWLAKRSMTWR